MPDSKKETGSPRGLVIQLSMGVLIVVTFAISAFTKEPAPSIVYASLLGIGVGARPETFIQFFRRVP